MVHNGSALFVVVVVFIGQTSTFNNMHDSKTIRFRLLATLLYTVQCILYRIKFLCHFILLLVFADVTGKQPNDFCFQHYSLDLIQAKKKVLQRSGKVNKIRNVGTIKFIYQSKVTTKFLPIQMGLQGKFEIDIIFYNTMNVPFSSKKNSMQKLCSLCRN